MAIMGAEYDSFNSYADDMKSYGDSAFDNISNAFSKLGNLSINNGWKGARYDELVTSFNNMITDLNSMFIDIQETIPSNVHFIGDQIAKYNGKTIEGRNYTSKTLSEVSKSGATGFVFDETKVGEAKKQIADKFRDARANIDSIDSAAKKMVEAGVWSGTDYEKWYPKISKYKKLVHENLNNLITDFSECMKQAKDDFDTLQKNINSSITVGE